MLSSYRKSQGNLPQILGAIDFQGTSMEWCLDNVLYHEFMPLVFRDLIGQRFIVSNNKTLDDYVSVWLKPNISLSYTQGNMDGALLTEVNLQLTMLSDKFSSITGKPDETRIDYVENNLTTLKFAYFDNDGIPCGFSISYLKTKPSIWSAAITQDTPNSPENRKVTFIAHEAFVLENHSDLVLNENIMQAVSEPLNSDDINRLIQGLFLQNGDINQAVVEHINQSMRVTSESNKFKVKDARISALVKLKG